MYVDDNFEAHHSKVSPHIFRHTGLQELIELLRVSDEKIRVYDKGVEKITSSEGIYETLVKYRTGDMWAPQVEHTEALKKELEYFTECIACNRTPINDGKAGWRVVSMLEAANRSVKKKGSMVEFRKEEAIAI